jgi:ArsR family transcriptional regulator, arsenate/arsenite/antimonite-responsive transcriptional repressor
MRSLDADRSQPISIFNDVYYHRVNIYAIPHLIQSSHPTLAAVHLPDDAHSTKQCFQITAKPVAGQQPALISWRMNEMFCQLTHPGKSGDEDRVSCLRSGYCLNLKSTVQYIGSYRYDMTTTTVPNDLLIFLKALASESRLNIVLLFLDGQERTVNQIASAVDLGQPATSEHLAVLKHSGILFSRKEGKEVYYCPDTSRVLQMLAALDRLLRSCCS